MKALKAFIYQEYQEVRSKCELEKDLLEITI